MSTTTSYAVAFIGTIDGKIIKVILGILILLSYFYLFKRESLGRYSRFIECYRVRAVGRREGSDSAGYGNWREGLVSLRHDQVEGVFVFMLRMISY